jgi:5-methylcytosine-specific restriction protein A
LDAPQGFSINITHSWRSIEASFVPDSFATGLMKTLCADEAKRRNEFILLHNIFSNTGIKCVVRVNDSNIDVSNFPQGSWTRFSITCTKLSDKSDGQHDVEEVAGACLALLLTLLPTDDEAEPYLSNQGLPEGALMRVMVNRYERRPSNRAAAIAAHGVTCKACGFDFSEFYGELGESFIEIHHKTPVSLMGTDYVVDPVKDLVPLCSNCHQMIHRENPPISVEKLHDLLMERGTIWPSLS